MLVILLLLLVIASFTYWIVACWWVLAFFRRPAPPPASFTPPVSILKPARGVDYQAYENFASFCEQDYPEYELLFGVSDLADPVVEVIRRLQQQYPRLSIRIIQAPSVGVNPKASSLHALAQQTRYEILVLSDSDMRVTPDYLRRVVAPLADESIGLVTCPYHGVDPVTFTARLEALHMGVTFLPGVIVARRFLRMRFAMGATNALRRSDLARIGGFASFADYLADDYQLGARIAAAGLRVHLSDYIVSSVLGATAFREQWDREVRWAHCNRISRPNEYPGLALSFSTLLALMLLVATGFSLMGWLVFGAALLLRWVVAWLVTGATGDLALRRWLIWLPVRDMLSALIWFVGLIGNRVAWRGRTYVLSSGGHLELIPGSNPDSDHRPSPPSPP